MYDMKTSSYEVVYKALMLVGILLLLSPAELGEEKEIEEEERENRHVVVVKSREPANRKRPTHNPRPDSMYSAVDFSGTVSIREHS